MAQSQTVQLVVPYTAGGVNDRVARVLEKTLSKRLSYNFVVDYQVGAGGIIAANAVAKNQTKDTILLVHSASIVTNTINPQSTYNLFQDFTPVAKLGSVPMVLIANKQSSITTVKHLKQLGRPIFYATAGTGTASHVAGELLRQNLNKELYPVFYKGESAAFNDVLSNNVPIMFVSAGTAMPYLNSLHISILGVSGSHRSNKLPNVPTLTEQGIQGFDRSPNWIVVLANSKADPATVTNIKRALEDSFVDREDIELYNTAGIDLDRQPLLNITQFLKQEVERTQKLQIRFEK